MVIVCVLHEHYTFCVTCVVTVYMGTDGVIFISCRAAKQRGICSLTHKQEWCAVDIYSSRSLNPVTENIGTETTESV